MLGLGIPDQWRNGVRLLGADTRLIEPDRPRDHGSPVGKGRGRSTSAFRSWAAGRSPAFEVVAGRCHATFRNVGTVSPDGDAAGENPAHLPARPADGTPPHRRDQLRAGDAGAARPTRPHQGLHRPPQRLVPDHARPAPPSAGRLSRQRRTALGQFGASPREPENRSGPARDGGSCRRTGQCAASPCRKPRAACDGDVRRCREALEPLA